MKKNFRTLIKCWTCDNAYVDEDVIVRDYCYITADYRGVHIQIVISMLN